MSNSILGIDTEGTGLFPSKGCQAFMLTMTSYDEVNYMWRFPVDPLTRLVSYSPDTIKEIVDVMMSYDILVFHNANYDMQILNNMNIDWKKLFRQKQVHDTMVMSHAYKSSNPHGLKENGVVLLQIPDNDEKELEEATKQSRRIAKELDWYIAEEDSQHPSLIGHTKEHYRSDYWVPYEIAAHLDYPQDHPWRHVCAKYAVKDTERTVGLFLVLRELMSSERNPSTFNNPAYSYPLPTPIINYTGTLYDKYVESNQLVPVLLSMQQVGVPVKPRALTEATKEFTTRKENTLSKLRSIANDSNFNPDSPIQLRKVLFDQLKFKPVKQGKAGPSADKDVINKLLSDAPINHGQLPTRYEFLLHLKDFRKEKATLSYLNNYEKHSRVSSLKKYRGTPERLLYTSFAQTRTGTGRLSSENPNTTNVGKKDMSNPFADEKDSTRRSIFAEILGIDEDSRFSLRNVFGPRSGEQWTCIDYDQFQLRIFAVVSESHELVDAFNQGRDIHNVVACKIFNKDEISDVERTAAKAINFGLLFGAGPGKIELLAGVPGLYSTFMSAFPKAKKYLDAQSSIARSKGYVHTVGGYRLYVPRNAPHAASCYVIQGTEAEIVKRAMVGVHHYLGSIQYSSQHSQSSNSSMEYRTPTLPRLSETTNGNTNTRTTQGARTRIMGPTSTIERRVPIRRPSSPNLASKSYTEQEREAPSRLLGAMYSAIDTSIFTLLMMVHDELVFSSRNMRVADIADSKGNIKKEFQDDDSMWTELSTIMDIMEHAGKIIGIPAKVDAKITTTDWATRHSLIFNRAPF